MRKTGRRFIPLWKKQNERVNLEEIENDIEVLKAAEGKSQINWVEKIIKGGGFNG